MLPAPPSTSVAEPRQGERETIAFLGALTGITAIGIDVLLPALGDIRTAFDLDPDATQVSLLVTFYLIGLGLGQLLCGPFADRFGRRPVIFVGLAIFVLAALGVVVAPTLEVAMVLRFVMGLGASTPRAMAMAVARDRWHGDAMARVMALVMMFFMLAPAVAPLFGQAILVLGPWEAIFVFMALVGVLLGLWSYRFEETLAPADRIPLTFERTRRSAGIVVGSRWAMGHGLLVMFELGAFVTYLGSSELIFDDVFGRGDQFAFFFAGGALVMAAANLLVSRLIPRMGAERVIMAITVGYVAVAALFYVLTAAAGGSPAFWPWIGLLVVLNAFHSVMLPTANSLAMQPLGRFAGTGSGIIGTLSTIGGAVLASLVSATVDGSATPLGAAYLIFGAAALASLLWGRRGSPSALGS